MRYRVRHVTSYDYSSNVSLSHNQIRLSPRVLEHQLVEWPKLVVSPEPSFQRAWVDGFGNRNHFFSMEMTHRTMTVSAESVIDRQPPKIDMATNIPWESIAERLRHPSEQADAEAVQFVFDSRYSQASDEVLRFAEPSFPPGRSIVEATADLNRRIFDEFEYDPSATLISTPTLTVLQERRGVCQDFAHLQIACLRSLGLAARYVSGYLLTHPPAVKSSSSAATPHTLGSAFTLETTTGSTSIRQTISCRRTNISRLAGAETTPTSAQSKASSLVVAIAP